MSNSAMAKPINWKSNLFFVWVAEICSRAGFSVAIPFIPFFMRDRYLLSEGAVKNGVMLFGLAGSVALFFSFPLWGMVGDRLGRRLMLLRAMFCSGILYASFMFAPTLGILIALRFITGFFSGTVSPAQALVATTTPEDKHGFALGVLSSSVWSGNMLGLLLGGLVVKYGSYNAFWHRLFGFAPESMIAANWSYNLAFALTMVLFFFAGMIVLFFVRENFVPPPPAPVADGTPRRKEFALAGFGGAVYAILGMLLWISFARRCDENYISLMVEVVSGLKGKEAAHIVGTIGFAAAVGNVLAAVSIGFFSDRVPLRYLIPPIAVVGAAAMTGEALSTAPLMLGGFRLLAFLMAGGLEPAALGVLSRESPKAKKGTIFGCVASLRILGLMLGTFLGWAVMKICDRLPWERFAAAADPHAFGIRGIFLLGALAMLLLIPWVFFVERMVAKRHREIENRTS